jgi:hypothetical protein
MRKLLLYLTGFCIALFFYLAYLGESVEAWIVIPWMGLVFMSQHKDFKDNE